MPARGWRGRAFSSSSRARPSWPDAKPAELYAFRHDLYRELLYDRLPATRRAVIMRGSATGSKRLGGRLDAIAAEMAEHFERGNEPVRAIPHHQRAAAKALRRSANAEAIGHLRRALDAIGHIADEDERAGSRSSCMSRSGAAFMATRGFGAPEVLRGLCAGRSAVRPPGRACRHVPGDLGTVAVPLGPQRDGERVATRAAGCWRSRKSPAMPG